MKALCGSPIPHPGTTSLSSGTAQWYAPPPIMGPPVLAQGPHSGMQTHDRLGRCKVSDKGTRLDSTRYQEVHFHPGIAVSYRVSCSQL